MKFILSLKDKVPHQILLRRALQTFYLLFFTIVGINFFFYAEWALGKSEHYIQKMPAVAAFLPIGGLVGLKRLVLTGQYETVHPASLTIFIMAIVLAFSLRKSFCGYFCPIGSLATILESLGKKFNIQRRPPRWLSYILSTPKYLLLLVFLYLILPMDVWALDSFMQSQYWRVADTKMLLFFFKLSSTGLVIIGVFCLGNLIIPGFWCTGFCPYGALLGLFSLFSPVAVQRKAKNCSSCQRCSQACASRIEVHKKLRVNSPDCVGCGECIALCPEEDCLSFRLGYSSKGRKIKTSRLGGLSLLLLLFIWFAALSSGHWYGPVNKEQIRQDHLTIKSLAHP